MELFAVEVPAELVGKMLEATSLGALSGVNVIALQRDGKIEPAPAPTLPLPPRPELLLVGTHEQRQRFAQKFG